jgi:hypothetical protein
MEVRQFVPNREPVNNEFASLQVSELSSLVELSTLLAQACWILGLCYLDPWQGFQFFVYYLSECITMHA